MSALRRVTALLAAMFLVALGGAAHAQTITARVGDAFGRSGQYIDVPVTVDMSGAPGLRLGSYRAELHFDPQVLVPLDASLGDFALPVINTDSLSVGKIRFTAIQPSGADGVITLVVLRFFVVNDTLAANLTLSFDEMSASGSFTDLLPYLLPVQPGTFCRSVGTWGDVDGDGRANSRDALVVLSKVVGLLWERDTVVVDTVLHDTTITMRPSLADVDADGAVTSRDALIIMTHAVGLPMDAFRIGQPAAGACSATGTVTLTVSPDTLELQSGQYATIVVAARDAAGRPMPSSSVTWRSSNSAVATFLQQEMWPFIIGRDPGVATVTAELSPGVRASVTVRVVARRVHWYVDAIRATNAVTQTGSPRHPMAYIGYAIDYSQDGDTIHVAPGNYEEVVDRWVAVALIGDSLNRPVIDARGYPDYDPLRTKALQLGSLAGQVTLQNLRIVGGGVFVGSHDLAVRNVRIDAPLTRDAFIFVGPMGSPGAAPPAPSPVAASVPIEPAGKALIDGLYVAGYQETGIVAFYADSVIVRNSAAIRDALGTADNCYPMSMQFGGIFVGSGSSTEIRDNTVTNAQCTAIRARSAQGRAVISRNRVLGARAGGIVVSADTVALDHNVVRDVVDGDSSESVGIGVAMDTVTRWVTSLGDSVINVGQRGFAAESALVGVIDSLVVDGTGQDLSSGSPGVDLRFGRYTLRESHISNTLGGVGVMASGAGVSLDSRRNVIDNTGAEGILVFDPCYLGCVEYAPAVGRTPASASQSSSVSDTLRSVGDTFRATGSSAIVFGTATYALVDSADVDGVVDGAGVEFIGVGAATIRRSSIRNTAGWGRGIYASDVDTVAVDRVAISDAASTGIYLEDIWAAAKVYGATVDNSGSTGLSFSNNYSSAPLTVDSSRFAGSAANGIYLYCYECGALGAVTRTSIAGNAGGLLVDGYVSGAPLTLAFHHNTIAGNTLGGVWNQAAASGVSLAAEDNYWGDPSGPTCSIAAGVTGCGVSAGDSIMTQGVTFIPWLTVADGDIMTAPAVMPAVSPPRVAVAGIGDRSRASRASQARPRPTPLRPRMTGTAAPAPVRRATEQRPWQRGRPTNQPAPSH